MDVTNTIYSLFSSLNFFTQNATTSIPKNPNDVIYGFTALLEIGLHPMRGDTKYYFDREFSQLKPMVAKDNKLNLYVCEVPLQGAKRELYYRASHRDLFILDAEIIKNIKRYLWDPNFQAQALIFFRDILKPGLESLKEITYKGKDFKNHIEDWITLIDCAITEPITKDNFKSLLSSKDSKKAETAEFFKNTLELVQRDDSDFGKKIKALLTLDTLTRINEIYLQKFILPEKAHQKTIEKATTEFNNIVIQTAEEQIEALQQEFLTLKNNALSDTSDAIIPFTPPATTPVEIQRPGGAKPYTPKTTPTNSISISPSSLGITNPPPTTTTSPSATSTTSSTGQPPTSPTPSNSSNTQTGNMNGPSITQ